MPFALGSATVDGDTSELLDAAANRARSCGIEVLVVSRGYAELSSLAERRAQIAYEGLAERGVRIRDGEMIACERSTGERAVVTIFFPVSPLPSPDLNMPC